MLTAERHDGFCLWPTETTDYSVASSPWKDGTGDVVSEVADAARRYGLGLGLYLSPWGRHEPKYADLAAYDEFYLRQLRELCTNYGDLLYELQPDAMVFTMDPAAIRWIGDVSPCFESSRESGRLGVGTGVGGW